MTRFYAQAARLSGMAAFVCAVLAVLAHPGVSRADPPNCYDVCGGYYETSQFYDCFNACYGNQVYCSGGPCDNGCSKSLETGCDGACDNTPPKGVCTNCKCLDITLSGCTCTW